MSAVRGICLATATLSLAAAAAAQAATFNTLATFTTATGLNPRGPVVVGANGNVYGTAYYGGASGFGTVFQYTAGTGTLAADYSFTGTGNGDQGNPSGGLIADAAGNLYGTSNGYQTIAPVNGQGGFGTVFKLASDHSTFTNLYSFSGTLYTNTGRGPRTPLAFDSGGNLIGTTQYGGTTSGGIIAPFGNVFQLSAASGYSTETNLANLDYNNIGARYPSGGVTVMNGNAYGALYGNDTGASGIYGALYVTSASNASNSAPTLLNYFSRSSIGQVPVGTPVADKAGNLYCVTTSGTGNGSSGTIFELKVSPTSSTGYANTENYLSYFGDIGASSPVGSLLIDANGDLFGTTSGGGAYGNGEVFEYNAATASLSTLASFNTPGGTFSPLTFDSAGNLYGTTYGTANSSTAGGTLFEITMSATAAPAHLTWNNGNAGNGTSWDTTQLNWNNGTGTVAYSNSSNGSLGGDIVTFNDTNNNHYNVSIATVLTPTSTTINTNSSSGYTFNGSGGIGGVGSLTKLGTGLLTLNTINSYSGGTNISGGTVILGVAGALPVGTNLTINGSGTSLVANSVGTAYALQVGTLTISGGTLDLNNNDLAVHSGTLLAVNGLVASGYNSGNWNGSGIVSSTAASNHLMALGVILNDNGMSTNTPLYGSGGVIASTFGGAAPVDGDLLVKYTYYGDANLDGQVDGSDYSRIDAAYIANRNTPGSVTGWYNGDFNYDGVVDGSDYALIDNGFNNQGAQISNQLAASTAQIAPADSAAVPEPATGGVLAIGALGLIGRRRRSGSLVA